MQRGGFLTQSDREALDRFPPEIDVLRRCFWLGEHERREVVERRYGPAARLAGGLQLGALRLLGFVPTGVALATEQKRRWGCPRRCAWMVASFGVGCSRADSNSFL